MSCVAMPVSAGWKREGVGLLHSSGQNCLEGD